MIQQINIPLITLNWSDWVPWNSLRLDAGCEGKVKVPNQAGVYEARCKDDDERLTIGKTSDLQRRIKKGLVKGTLDHSTGKKIRAKEDVLRIVVRWAVTDRPSAVEEELHKQYIKKFGELPKHTKHT